ncbi:MAG: ankyrin repeat domain-containing protein [Pirellulales bacterium]
MEALALIGLLATRHSLRKRRNNRAARRGLWTLIALLLSMSVGFAGFTRWPRTSTLVRAIEHGQPRRVALCLAWGVDPNLRAYKPRGWWNGGGWQEGPYPLTVAAGKGEIRIFEALLAHGASVELAGGPAICAASGAGHLEIVRRLLDRGVSASSGPAFDEGRQSALEAAVGARHHAVMSLLLDRWGTVTIRGRSLATAVSLGDEAATELLLAHGAPIDAHVDAYASDTILCLAVKRGALGIVRMILEAGADPNQLGSKQSRDRPIKTTPLELAHERGDQAIVELLLEHGAVESTP